MFDRGLSNKIDDLIKEKFPIIYDYNFDGIVLLYGGTVRNLIMDENINDFDFVILTQAECQILDFIRKFKLKYYKNEGNGYKILFNGFTIDMISKNDLLDVVVYDCDALFYDIYKHMFISCGAINAFKKRVVTEINSQEEPLYSNKKRLKKIIEFIKHISKSNKKVKVKQNKILWEYKIWKKRFKIYINKILTCGFVKCFRFLENCKKEFILILILGFIIVLLSMITPALSGKIVEGIFKGNNKLVICMAFEILLLNIMSTILSFFFSKLYLVIEKRMTFNIRKKITECILNFELDSFNNNRGIFIDKISNDPKQIAMVFNNIKDMLVKGLGNIVVLFYIFYLNYLIGIVLLFFMVTIFVIKMIGVKKKRKYINVYFNEHEKCTSLLGEMINGVSEIKGLNLKNNYMKIANSSFESIGENEFKGIYYQKLYNKIAKLIEYVASGIVLLLGLYLVDNSVLDASSLVVIYMYNAYIFTFLERLGLLMNLSSDLDISCNRIFGLIDGNIYNSDCYGHLYKENCVGNIEFSNVKFKYHYKNNYVLKDCTFSVKSGENLAIVGKSGSGKTTILNLLSRLYDVQDGCVKIDDVDIREYSEKFIRENISIISQSPYLFDMSIKDNLRLVKENITDEEIVDVCKMVCMDEYIQSLPNKYDTIIGEGGVELSGGQKQRLGLARALIKNTKIILLDEITSALDNDTGTVIKKMIKNIGKGRTIIIVTHELSMIKDCSRILVLDNGKIVNDGKHSELLRTSDIYNKLYKIK